MVRQFFVEEQFLSFQKRGRSSQAGHKRPGPVMASEMDSHAASLLHVCRVGGAALKSLTKYSVREHSEELQACFGVDVSEDVEGVHPPNFCAVCVRVIRRYQAAVADGRRFERSGGGCGEIQVWVPHQTSGCEFCQSRMALQRGGAKKKKRRPASGRAGRWSHGSQSGDAGSSVSIASAPATTMTASDRSDSDSDSCAPSASGLAHGVGHPMIHSRPQSQVQAAAAPGEAVSDMDVDAPRPLPYDQPAAAAAAKTVDDPTLTEQSEPGADCSLEELLQRATPDYRTNDDCYLTTDRAVPRPFSDLTCMVCQCILNEAVESPCCHQLFCARCLMEWLALSNVCPHCRCRGMSASQLLPPHPRLAGILSEVNVECDYASASSDLRLGCTEILQLKDLRAHCTTECGHRPGGAPHSPLRRVITPASNVADILTASPSKLQGDTSRQLTRRLVTAQETGGRLEIATGGRPQTWIRVTRGHSASSAVTDRTLRQRTAEMEQLRQVVSASSSATQQAHELRHLAKAAQDQLLKDAGLAPDRTGPRRGAALAMKSDLHLPWYRLRKLRLWLSSFGVHFESEAEMRQQVHTDLPFHLLAEDVPLAIDKSGTIALRPMVRFPDLTELVLHYIMQHYNAGSLCWPSENHKDEIWVKLGGDHGGKSFKLCFQLGNVPHPNSVKNTVPVITFAAKDTPSNLATAFQPYAEQVTALRNTQWDGKAIRVVFFGDYEFLCLTYGLSGPSGYRPCLFCLTTKAEFQV